MSGEKASQRSPSWPSAHNEQIGFQQDFILHQSPIPYYNLLEAWHDVTDAGLEVVLFVGQDEEFMR